MDDAKKMKPLSSDDGSAHREFLDVSTITLVRRSSQLNIVWPWPFAVFGIDDRSILLGFGVPMSKFWKRRELPFAAIESATIDHNFLVVRQYDQSFYSVRSTAQSLDRMEGRLLSNGVKTDHSHVSKFIQNRNSRKR